MTGRTQSVSSVIYLPWIDGYIQLPTATDSYQQLLPKPPRFYPLWAGSYRQLPTAIDKGPAVLLTLGRQLPTATGSYYQRSRGSTCPKHPHGTALGALLHV